VKIYRNVSTFQRSELLPSSEIEPKQATNKTQTTDSETPVNFYHTKSITFQKRVKSEGIPVTGRVGP
jgi:hypothetical protein